ncbi:hypothetical protein, partial [uncultured Brevundimonas sp.]|uniref:hypothetical protein n=1 Tax=uncultured Brevundimonas sp. TaxID=213418 RepID=UPI0025E62283
WGGCSGSGTLPNSDEPMVDMSSLMQAGEGPKRGYFVSGLIFVDVGFGRRLDLWRRPRRGLS